MSKVTMRVEDNGWSFLTSRTEYRVRKAEVLQPRRSAATRGQAPDPIRVVDIQRRDGGLSARIRHGRGSVRWVSVGRLWGGYVVESRRLSGSDRSSDTIAALVRQCIRDNPGVGGASGIRRLTGLGEWPVRTAVKSLIASGEVVDEGITRSARRLFMKDAPRPQHTEGPTETRGTPERPRPPSRTEHNREGVLILIAATLERCTAALVQIEEREGLHENAWLCVVQALAHARLLGNGELHRLRAAVAALEFAEGADVEEMRRDAASATAAAAPTVNGFHKQ